MTAKFSKRDVRDSSSVETDIEHAKMRMIYEDPAAYADWRIKMGLARKPEGRIDPVMRAKVSGLFKQLGVKL